MRTIDCCLGWNWSENRLTIQTPVGNLTLTPLTDDTIRLRVEAQGGERVLPTPAVVKHDWPKVHATVTEEEGGLTLATAHIKAKIQLTPLRLSWYDGDRLFAVDEEIGVAPDRIEVRRQMPQDEHYYGFGQKVGYIDKRGRKMEMWTTDDPNHTPTTDPLYQTIPFFTALRQGQAHGLFVDCAARSWFDMGSLDPATTYTVEVHSPIYDAYIFAGPRMADITSRYTELTGRMEMPPLWSLGFHQCRWSYFPEAKIRDLARNFRERKIPCDVLWLDIDYMDGYRVFTWDRDRFPRPEQLAGDLAEEGFRLVTIIDPGVKVDPNYFVYQQGVQQGYFIKNPDGSVHVGRVWPGDSVYPDWLQARTREWWADLHKEHYFDKGVAGIWNDMNEPASFIPNEVGERTIPHDVLQGDDGRQVPHKDVHNLYGIGMNQATHAAFKKHLPERRPFILTRSGFAGIQRYAAVWMGDNHSWWEHIIQHMTICAGMGLSGVPFVGTDVGGFSAHANGELVARWIALGAFTPFFRMHAAAGTRDQEPWSFGPEVEAICRKYINLRYRLLPYFYTLMEEAHRTGLPVLRPLVLDYQDDPETYGISDQMLAGRDVLVAPVYQPGMTRRMVYLPAGTWYDFWTGQRHEGKQYIVADAPLDTIPLYVRAGAVLPMGPEMQHTGQVPTDTLTLHIYAGEGGFTLYEDEGEGYGYQQGVTARTRVSVGAGRIQVGTPEGGYKPQWGQVELLLHGFGDGTVSVDGQSAEAPAAEGGACRVLVSKAGGFTVEVR